MTDNEIIEAVEFEISCVDFPDDELIYGGVEVKTLKNALDLINRQKAEIERLTSALKQVKDGIAEAKVLLARDMAKAKAEAIKEFAERLKKELSLLRRECRKVLDNDGVFAIDRARKKVDNIVKETVGDV